MAIICPFYNEEKSIFPVCAKLLNTKYPLIFVDDGSTDRSLPILEDIQAKLGGFDIVKYYPNRGKGYAIRKGAEYAIKKGYDYMLFLDSDGQMDVEDIEKFIIVAEASPQKKIIIGNRFFNAENMPKIRYIINRFMSWVISLMAGQHIIDSQCGFRLVHKDVFAHNLQNEGFGLETEMLVKVGRCGGEVANVPVKCIYNEKRVSKIHPIKDTLKFILMLFNIYLKRI